MGRSRGGLTTKTHLVCDGRSRALAFILTPGQVADTSMLAPTLGQIRVPGAVGRPRTRPERVLADTGYPSKSNRAWLRAHGIAATIPERDDQIAHRRNKPDRPIDFGEQQKARYRGRNVVERCFNRLEQWRGIAMRSDKTAGSYHAGLCLAATLHWLTTSNRIAVQR
ncbi:IS5 family transposase [Rhodococcus chondri]|uniref:IS5 family transposase n=1 Tax=Rhodococcus chondri TaxID=3065941 RepID=A0ABU7JVW1_9NOCA|nr:IS5 family transposase [Rhodococcus sp. CC-R104]MEE2033985.1 IS5 family transposase [Rhodococcus sp. CC-R104]